MYRKRPATVNLCMVLWAFFFTAQVHANALSSSEVPLIENGGYIATSAGSPIIEYNAEKMFIPASTLKIATAFTALELLGPSYRFKTEFYLRDQDLLCIKGYGDPYLISEHIADIAPILKKKGLHSVGGLILDDTFFDIDTPADGSRNTSNPYDAINSALSVNFNSLPLIKYDTGAIASPEPQTPLLPIARDIAKYLEPGLHRVNVSSFTRKDASITHQRYVAELFAELLRKQGIAVGPVYRTERVKVSDALLHTYYSRTTLAEMIQGCLKFSNNFIANQLFLAGGAYYFNPPATWRKARETMRTLLPDKIGIKPSEFTILEGSGLSPKNRITPTAMIQLLEAFKPYAHLLNRTHDISLKSGTLTGVYNYAGYFETPNGLDPFVLLLNQQQNTRDALLTHLAGIHKQATDQSPFSTSIPSRSTGTP